MLEISPGTLSYQSSAAEKAFLLEVPRLTVPPRAVLVLRGRNGCGKSTLLSAIAGRFRHIVRSGILCQWVHSDGSRTAAANVASFCAANPLLLPGVSVREYVRFAGFCTPTRAPMGVTKASEILRRFGIPDDRQTATPDMLSTGQAKRVVLARMSGQKLPILLLDEPSANLDEDAEQLLVSLVRSTIESGGVAIIASHEEVPEVQLTLRAVIQRTGEHRFRMSMEG